MIPEERLAQVIAYPSPSGQVLGFKEQDVRGPRVKRFRLKPTHFHFRPFPQQGPNMVVEKSESVFGFEVKPFARGWRRLCPDT
jgi:hypothetical protein